MGGTQGGRESVEVHEDNSDGITAESEEGIMVDERECVSVGMEKEAGLSDLNEVLEQTFAAVDDGAVGKWVKGTAETLRCMELAREYRSCWNF